MLLRQKDVAICVMKRALLQAEMCDMPREIGLVADGIKTIKRAILHAADLPAIKLAKGAENAAMTHNQRQAMPSLKAA